MTEPYGISHFCDDIREEVGGKFSLMGVYSSDLIFIGSAPGQIPQLGIATTIIIPSSIEISEIKLVVSSTSREGDDKTVSEAMITPNDIEAHAYVKTGSARFQFNQKISPFAAVEPTTLKVRAYFGDFEVKLNTLKVSFSDQLARESQSAADIK